MIRLLHLSNLNNLKSVNPFFQGIGQTGEEKLSKYYLKPKYTNWYIASKNIHIEGRFDNNWLYEAQVDEKLLYDADKFGIPNGNKRNIKSLKNEIGKPIYIGIIYKNDGHVHLFYNQKVNKVGLFSIIKRYLLDKRNGMGKRQEKEKYFSTNLDFNKISNKINGENIFDFVVSEEISEYKKHFFYLF